MSYEFDNNYQYLDITIYGNTGPTNNNTLIKANYREQRTTPVLDKPSDWQLGIARFSLPSNNVPLFNFLNNKYLVTGSYTNGIGTPPLYSYSEYVQFTNYSNFTLYPNYQAVTNYSQFINMVNTTLYNVHQNLVTNATGFMGVTGVSPFLQYNSDSQIISYYSPTGYALTNPQLGMTGIGFTGGSILFNADLYYYFSGLDATALFSNPSGSEYQILVYSKFGNQITYNSNMYYQMDSSFHDVLNWDELDQVLVLTTSTPLIPEQKGFSNQQNAIFQSLLTDFNFAGISFRENGRLSFYNQSNIRWYDLISNQALTFIDLQFWYSDLAGNSFPIYIGPGDSANIKIEFRRKQK